MKSSEQIAINTIYRATEGEGVRIGTPQIFVRLQGCPVGCVNCDSRETWAYPPEMFKDLDWILRKVTEISHFSNPALKKISLTGGEPLAPKNWENSLKLIERFKEEGYFINLETSGVYYHHSIFDQVDFISIDYKTLSTRVLFNESNLIKAITSFPHKMQVKAVIQDENDFNQFYDFYQRMVESGNGLELPSFCMTPCYNLGEPFPLERFKELMNLNEKRGGALRFIGQQHKWIFGPNAKDV